MDFDLEFPFITDLNIAKKTFIIAVVMGWVATNICQGHSVQVSQTNHSTIAHVFSWVKFVSEKSIHPCVTTRLSINACVFF
jgi:hypothetical protein